jgi:hypothetical protein
MGASSGNSNSNSNGNSNINDNSKGYRVAYINPSSNGNGNSNSNGYRVGSSNPNSNDMSTGDQLGTVGGEVHNGQGKPFFRTSLTRYIPISRSGSNGEDFSSGMNNNGGRGRMNGNTLASGMFNSDDGFNSGMTNSQVNRMDDDGFRSPTSSMDMMSNNRFGNSMNGNDFGNNMNSNGFDNSMNSNDFRNNMNNNGFDNSMNSNDFRSNMNSNGLDNNMNSNDFMNNNVGRAGVIAIKNVRGNNLSSRTVGGSDYSLGEAGASPTTRKPPLPPSSRGAVTVGLQTPTLPKGGARGRRRRRNRGDTFIVTLNDKKTGKQEHLLLQTVVRPRRTTRLPSE